MYLYFILSLSLGLGTIVTGTFSAGVIFVIILLGIAEIVRTISFGRFVMRRVDDCHRERMDLIEQRLSYKHILYPHFDECYRKLGWAWPWNYNFEGMMVYDRQEGDL